MRSELVKSLLKVSKDFSCRAVDYYTRQDEQGAPESSSFGDFRENLSVSAEYMVRRMQGIMTWASSNHLLMVFHSQGSQTVSPMYRVKEDVPTHIRELFEKQLGQKIDDYKTMKQDGLQSILEKVVRSSRVPFNRNDLKELKSNYALTPDNLLKMVLIHLRIKSNIPVIIMGETGCGKTTLITYLARVCEVKIDTLNLHAGVTETYILNFVDSLRRIAESNLKQEVWGFFDEINACDHLGLLNEIICRHSCKGCPLPPNLVFVAACNPYKLKKARRSISSRGLKGRKHRDSKSDLVYRVHPLPESMLDYVWDFGSLDREDEIAYIKRMLEADVLDATFVDLLVMSQGFIRKVENTSYCVSLRDVNRCKELVKWFENMLSDKKAAHVLGDNQHLKDIKIRSIILALAHCYHSRLVLETDRLKYRNAVAEILRKKKKWQIGETDIEQLIRSEQLDLLNRMQLPDGTAKNEALRENVFVILVSILNRIPVFVVGKPGCSKSLSMQLIKRTMRGGDSRDLYFKSQPPLYVISHQRIGIVNIRRDHQSFRKSKELQESQPCCHASCTPGRNRSCGRVTF